MGPGLIEFGKIIIFLPKKAHICWFDIKKNYFFVKKIFSKMQSGLKRSKMGFMFTMWG